MINKVKLETYYLVDSLHTIFSLGSVLTQNDITKIKNIISLADIIIGLEIGLEKEISTPDLFRKTWVKIKTAAEILERETRTGTKLNDGNINALNSIIDKQSVYGGAYLKNIEIIPIQTTGSTSTTTSTTKPFNLDWTTDIKTNTKEGAEIVLKNMVDIGNNFQKIRGNLDDPKMKLLEKLSRETFYFFLTELQKNILAWNGPDELVPQNIENNVKKAESLLNAMAEIFKGRHSIIIKAIPQTLPYLKEIINYAKIGNSQYNLFFKFNDFVYSENTNDLCPQETPSKKLDLSKEQLEKDLSWIRVKPDSDINVNKIIDATLEGPLPKGFLTELQEPNKTNAIKTLKETLYFVLQRVKPILQKNTLARTEKESCVHDFALAAKLISAISKIDNVDRYAIRDNLRRLTDSNPQEAYIKAFNEAIKFQKNFKPEGAADIEEITETKN